MKQTVFKLLQCTWGIMQTALGLILFVFNLKHRHFSYHGAIVTEWDSPFSLSVGMFIFVSSDARRYRTHDSTAQENDSLFGPILVHEYGHAVQSLILGPLYLFVIGLPSLLWGLFAAGICRKKRIPYCAFFTERWANALGEKVTKEKSVGMMMV